ncbi:DUF4386 family protein [Geodermatophilus sp. SYSU D00815]
MDHTLGTAADSRTGGVEHASARRWDLIAGVAGLVFLVLVIASFFTPSTPTADEGADAIVRAVQEDRTGHQWSLLLGFLSDVAFLFFLAGVWGRLRRAEGLGGLFAGLFAIAAAAFVAVIAVSEGLYLALVQSSVDAEDEPSIVRTLVVLDNWVGGAALPAGVAMLLAVAAGVQSTLAFPRWLGWLAALAAVCLLVGFAAVFDDGVETGALGVVGFVGFLLVLVWTVAASVLLVLRPGTTARAHA